MSLHTSSIGDVNRAGAAIPEDGRLMRNEQQGHVQLFAKPAEQVEQPLLGYGIKSSSGLVGDQQIRLMGEGHGDGDTLPLASADLPGIAEEERIRAFTREALY